MRIPLVLLIAAASALLGGCSGGSSGNPFAAPSPKTTSGTVDVAVQNDAISNFYFTSIQGRGISDTPFSVIGFVKVGARGFRITAQGPPDLSLQRGIDVDFSLPAAMKVGEVIPVANFNQQTAVLVRVTRSFPIGNTTKQDDWDSETASLGSGSNGSLQITEFSATQLAIQLRDVKVTPLRNDVTLAGRAHGTLTLNGTLKLRNFGPFSI